MLKSCQNGAISGNEVPGNIVGLYSVKEPLKERTPFVLTCIVLYMIVHISFHMQCVA